MNIMYSFTFNIYMNIMYSFTFNIYCAPSSPCMYSLCHPPRLPPSFLPPSIHPFLPLSLSPSLSRFLPPSITDLTTFKGDKKTRKVKIDSKKKDKKGERDKKAKKDREKKDKGREKSKKEKKEKKKRAKSSLSLARSYSSGSMSGDGEVEAGGGGGGVVGGGGGRLKRQLEHIINGLYITVESKVSKRPELASLRDPETGRQADTLVA